MPETLLHRPGTFSWLDLAAHDLDAAERFYTRLFGWTADRMTFGPGEGDVYVMLKKDGRDAAAVYPMDPAQKAEGMPSAWLTYVTVESADDAAARARGLGATIMAEPFDVTDVGRMSLVQDPTGAMVALWEAKRHVGVGVRDEPGALAWVELATRDTGRAQQFYTGLFGWKAEAWPGAEMPYTMFGDDEGPTAGLFEMPKEMEGAPPHWMPYFAVEDADATAARARELGGTVVMGPQDIPEVGRFAVLRDPQGGVFSIIRMAEMPG